MRHLKRPALYASALALVGCASLLALSAPSIAQSAAVSPPPGRLLASNCFQCHSISGTTSGFDNIKGKSSNELYDEMMDFKSGREGNGLMARHAMGYTDAQIRLIADYLATLR
jgi:sulfide dehydrogenase cytochrome subunit